MRRYSSIEAFFCKREKVYKYINILMLAAFGFGFILFAVRAIDKSYSTIGMVFAFIFLLFLYGIVFCIARAIAKGLARKAVKNQCIQMLENSAKHGIVSFASRDTNILDDPMAVNFMMNIDTAMRNRSIISMENLNISVDYVVAICIGDSMETPIAIPKSVIDAWAFGESDNTDKKDKSSTLALRLKNGEIIECIINRQLGSKRSDRIKEALTTDMHGFLKLIARNSKKRFQISLAIVAILIGGTFLMNAMSKYSYSAGEKAREQLDKSLEGEIDKVNFRRVNTIPTKYLGNTGCYYSVYEICGSNELCIIKQSGEIPEVEAYKSYEYPEKECSYIMDKSDSYVSFSDIYTGKELELYSNNTGEAIMERSVVVYDVDQSVRYTPMEYYDLFNNYRMTGKAFRSAGILAGLAVIPGLIVFAAFLIIYIEEKERVKRFERANPMYNMGDTQR